ncbi:hypothetical protein OIU77_011985, partial [Salix suchowensis]
MECFVQETDKMLNRTGFKPLTWWTHHQRQPDREETMTKRRGSPTASTTLFTLLIFLLTTKRLRVVDVNLANGSCSLPYKSVSVEE